jgi:hypothetical protein
MLDAQMADPNVSIQAPLQAGAGSSKHILSLMSVEAAAAVLGVEPSLMKQAARRGEVPGAELHHGDWLFEPKALKSWWKGLLGEAKARTAKVRHADAKARSEKLRSSLVCSADILAAARPWPKSGSGIYFLICRGVIVYVGQARHVMKRLAQHTATKKFDAWHWVPCPPHRLNAVERAYINALMPPLNRDPVTCKLRSSKAMEGKNGE